MASMTSLVTLQNRDLLNGDLKPLSNSLMLNLFGTPRGNYDGECRSPTNKQLLALIVTDSVGPFKVTGLRPAVAALKDVMKDIMSERPDIYATIGTAGMLCCRYVRGSTSSISNHSWGCAVDLTIDGKLDSRGDGKAQQALVDIHPIFNRHGFYWGAAFPTEDAMHFEVSRQMLLRWQAEGLLGAGPATPLPDAMSIGDRGSDVKKLQHDLNMVLGLDIDEDGIFGPATRAAVIEFQRQHQLVVDGVAGRKVLEALNDLRRI